jgi:hypothetical protein
MRRRQPGEPLFEDAQFGKHIVVDVNFEAEDFAFLEMGLEGGVCAARLTLLVTA